MAENERMSLEARGISKRYGERWVVRDVSFRVSRGEIVGLLGPNGAGKTTSFYAVVGLIQLNQGDIFLGGENITSVPMYRRAKRGIVYLPQETSVFRRLSVRDNIEAILEFKGLSRSERSRRLEEIVQEMGLQRLMNSPAHALSGGERRRVEIARALAMDPQYLLLDEPFTGIDPLAVKDIQNILNKLVSQQIGILITDHNVRETLKITHQAYILNEGRILAQGHPVEIAREPRVRKVYLGEDFEIN